MLAHPRLVRFLLPWLVSLKPKWTALKYESPWMPFEAKDWLESFLTPDMLVFEYGSGGSTIFVSKRVRKLVSVEHDWEWYSRISQTIKEKNISNCVYLYRKAEPDSARYSKSSPMDPEGYLSSLPEYKDMSFENYVKSIEEFPNESFDLVVIDGRARPSCISHAISKVRLGGFIMLDNSDRDEYQMGKDLLANWEQTQLFGPVPHRLFSLTTAWKRQLIS